MVSGKSHSPQKPPTKPKAKPPAAPKSKVDEIVDQVVEIVAAAVDEALTPANPFAHIPGSEQFVSWENARRMGLDERAAMKPEEAARLAASKTADASLPGDTIGQTVNADPF